LAIDDFLASVGRGRERCGDYIFLGNKLGCIARRDVSLSFRKDGGHFGDGRFIGRSLGGGLFDGGRFVGGDDGGRLFNWS
jgi:hypothetical protein